MDQFPRRNDVSQMVPAEKTILDAMTEVEKLPADTRLTEAVVLLGKAKSLISDYIDQK